MGKYNTNYFIGHIYFSITFVELWIHMISGTCFQELGVTGGTTVLCHGTPQVCVEIKELRLLMLSVGLFRVFSLKQY